MILDEILKILKGKSEYKAYTIGEKSYTYRQLYEYVANIYDFLLKENKEKKPVIVYGHKQIYMKATILACSFAGMPYVPIDESTPKQRIELIIEQINPDIIIGDFEEHNKSLKIISKNKIHDIMEKEKHKEIEKNYMKPENTYYIIFTSGSTGIPKGVKVSYNNVNSCINWLKILAGQKRQVILNQANFSFDLSIADFYLSLVTESEHYIIDSIQKLDYSKIFGELKKSRASTAVLTPTFADLLLLDKTFNQELMPDLRKIIFCGEKLQTKTVDELYRRFKELKVINTYGPTECTFAVTSYEVPRNFQEENFTCRLKGDNEEKPTGEQKNEEKNSMVELKSFEDEIPVGKPKSDVEIYIVDKDFRELSENETGEILITGESVASGYLNFVENNTFITYKGKKAYLTGDIGYYKNGNIYCKGRKDRQVKYKGFRIEISDIENNIQQLKYIEKVVVVAKKNKIGNVTSIIAFVKTIEEIEKIQQDLKKILPEYMIPKIKIIENFPINNNGKCDEKKLLDQ